MKTFILTLLVLISVVSTNAQQINTLPINSSYLCVAQWKVGEQKRPLMKWENMDTIRIKIEGKQQFMDAISWKTFTQQLTELTGLTFIETRDTSKIQIHIFIGTLNDYFAATGTKLPENLSPKLSNWSSRKWNNKRQLYMSDFCIDPALVRDDNQGIFYLKNLFLKSIGLLGVLNDETSIFNKYYTGKNAQLSKTDLQIVKIHYNPLMKAGMDSTQIDEVIKNL